MAAVSRRTRRGLYRTMYIPFTLLILLIVAPDADSLALQEEAGSQSPAMQVEGEGETGERGQDGKLGTHSGAVIPIEGEIDKFQVVLRQGDNQLGGTTEIMQNDLRILLGQRLQLDLSHHSVACQAPSHLDPIVKTA